MKVIALPADLETARREKRTAQLKGWVPPSLAALYKDFVKAHPSYPRVSISDYVYEVLEEHAAVRIAKQKIGGRVGQQ